MTPPKKEYICARNFQHEGVQYHVGDVITLDRAEAGRLGMNQYLFAKPETFEKIPHGCGVAVICLLYKSDPEHMKAWARGFNRTAMMAHANVKAYWLDNSGEDYEGKAENRKTARAAGIAYTEAPKNLGFGNGVNYMAGRVDADIFVFVNDDCYFPHPWVDQLIEPLRKDEKTAVTGARLLKPDGGTWENFERPNWVCGACFAIRRKLFFKVGGFDKRYFFSWEETDLCRLFTKLGMKCEVIPSAQVGHIGGETADLRSDFAQEHFKKGQRIFDQKWNSEGRIVGTMLVGNEKGRYLEESLAWLAPRVDRLVILDDHSTDGTLDILRAFQKAHPDKVVLYRNPRPLFVEDESMTREHLHFLALKENPRFIMPIDADEELSRRFDEDIAKLKSLGGSFNFPIVHLWGDRKTRRIDGQWGTQGNIRFYEVRWDKKQNFYASPIHCGSAPVYAYLEKKDFNAIALIHKGWMRIEDFEAKKERYKKLDPNGYHEPQRHWDAEPITVPFEDSLTHESWKL